MKKEEVIKKVQEELPEFNWKENDYYKGILTNIACAEISIMKKSRHSEDSVISIPDQVMTRIVEYLEEGKILYELSKKYDYGEILVEDIDENILDKIIKGLRLWKEGIDKLRKSDVDEDQLIIIHPDWNLEDFEKDFKFISGDKDDYDYRLGIMSTKDWDFNNDDLCRELQENSGDCFAIGPEEEEYDYDEEDENDDEDIEEKEYPEISKITKIYGTDFD